MCKNVFAMNNGIIVLTFHEQDLTKGCGRGLQGPEPDAKLVPGPAHDFSNGPGKWEAIFPTGRAGKWQAIFPTGRSGPTDEGWFFQRAGKRETSSGRLVCTGLTNRPVQTSIWDTEWYVYGLKFVECSWTRGKILEIRFRNKV